MADKILVDLLAPLRSGEALATADAVLAAQAMADEAIALEEKEAFLTALNKKGETAGELAAFADVFRQLAVDPGLGSMAGDAIDVCGTGGDGIGSFNVSTAVAFLLASLDVPVFKHGNRSITSKCGSADLLEACGIPLNASPELVRAGLEEVRFAFFFAPAYHPAFKAVMPVRKALAAVGQRSIFNLLGPLINPARPAHQLMGVFAPAWVEPIAEAFDGLGLKSAGVVHCGLKTSGGLDELSVAGENHFAGAGRLSTQRLRFEAGEVGLQANDLSDLAGGDVAANLAILHRLFELEGGGVPQGLRDSVTLNAGTALWILGKASDIQSGIAVVDEQIASGRAGEWLRRAQQFFRKYGAR